MPLPFHTQPSRVAADPSPTLPDILAPDLDVIFCGINPGLGAATSGRHFLNRSNRFWRVLYLAGFTPIQLSPQHDHTLLRFGCGLTTAVPRATVSAAELRPAEFRAAAADLEHKIANLRPRFLAFLGKAAATVLLGQRTLPWGRQTHTFGGAALWVLPNPSGLNRAFRLNDLVVSYRDLYNAVHSA